MTISELILCSTICVPSATRKDLLTIKITDSDLKVHPCPMQISYLYASDSVPFKNIYKLVKRAETITKYKNRF